MSEEIKNPLDEATKNQVKNLIAGFISVPGFSYVQAVMGILGFVAVFMADRILAKWMAAFMVCIERQRESNLKTMIEREHLRMGLDWDAMRKREREKDPSA